MILLNLGRLAWAVLGLWGAIAAGRSVMRWWFD